MDQNHLKGDKFANSDTKVVVFESKVKQWVKLVEGKFAIRSLKEAEVLAITTRNFKVVTQWDMSAFTMRNSAILRFVLASSKSTADQATAATDVAVVQVVRQGSAFRNTKVTNLSLVKVA